MEKKTKTGGRTQGTPNVITSQLRSVLKEMLFVELQNLPGYLAELPVKDRVYVVTKLMAYVLPKVENVSSYDGEPLGSQGWWNP